jgi:hypothetical protein
MKIIFFVLIFIGFVCFFVSAIAGTWHIIGVARNRRPDAQKRWIVDVNPLNAMFFPIELTEKGYRHWQYCRKYTIVTGVSALAIFLLVYNPWIQQLLK